jgi:hypothetical protein
MDNPLRNEIPDGRGNSRRQFLHQLVRHGHCSGDSASYGAG